MIDPRPVQKKMLIEPIDVRVTNRRLNFDVAKSLADSLARNKASEPMLLAWFDRKAWRHSPAVVCGCDEKPDWLVYAQSRGANISIFMNEGEYVFLYKEAKADN